MAIGVIASVKDGDLEVRPLTAGRTVVERHGAA